MTVPATGNRYSYSGDGSTADFSFPRLYLAKSNITVYVVLSDGTVQTKVLNTDYSLTAAGDTAGGTVTFNTAPPAGSTVVIVRDTARTQNLNLTGVTSFPRESAETAYDRAMLAADEAHRKFDRTLRLADYDPSSLTALPLAGARANMILGFDDNGDRKVYDASQLGPVRFAIPYDGTTDASDAINALLGEGYVVDLRNETEGSYLISKPLVITETSSGLICSTGKAKIKMNMASGAFDNTIYANREKVVSSGADRYTVGIYANGVLRPIVQNIRIVPSAWTEYSYIVPINFRSCTDIQIVNNEITNFCRGLMIILNDCQYGNVVGNYIHDIYSKSEFGPDGVTDMEAGVRQISGMQIDGDCVSGSKFLRITHNHISDITQSADILASLGVTQTDGINLQGNRSKASRKNVIAHNIIVNVGDGIDCFGDDNLIADNYIERCFENGIKLIHGHNRNLVIGNSINECGLSGIRFGAADEANSAKGSVVRDNKIHRINSKLDTDGATAFAWRESDGTVFYQGDGTTTYWSNVYNSGSGTATAGIRIDVFNTGYDTNNVSIFDNVMGLGNASYGIMLENTAGASNIFVKGNQIAEYTVAEYYDARTVIVWLETFRHVIECQSNFSLSAVTTAQNLFDSSGSKPTKFNIYAGRRYRLKVKGTLGSLSSSSNSLSFGLALTTAVISRVLGTGTGHKGSGGSTSVAHTNLNSATAQIITNADTQTGASFEVDVTFYCTTSGTLAPQVQMNTNAAAAVVIAGTVAELIEDRNTGVGLGSVA